MKKIFTLLFLSAGALFLADCSSTKNTAGAAAKSSPETRVAEVKKNYSEAQMAEGKTLWEDNCNKCHKLFAPESRTVDKWENVLPRMTKRSKLTDDQAALVRAYLLAHAKTS